MYTKRTMAYSEPYKLLAADGMVGVRLPAGGNITEIDAPIADMTRSGSMVVWASGMMAVRIVKDADYAYYKTRLIKLHYSLDDQMAVMLNNDAEEMWRMQAWRAWASATARKIMETINE